MKSRTKDPAEKRAEELKEMADAASHLGNLRGQLAEIRGLLSKTAGGEEKIRVLFDDGKGERFPVYGSHRDRWQILASETLHLSTPILGAAETALREQIRKQEALLRQMGVDDV